MYIVKVAHEMEISGPDLFLDLLLSFDSLEKAHSEFSRQLLWLQTLVLDYFKKGYSYLIVALYEELPNSVEEVPIHMIRINTTDYTMSSYICRSTDLL